MAQITKKLDQKYFDLKLYDLKRWEIRHEDFDGEYNNGDTITYREWNSDRREYTGREIRADVVWVLRYFEGLADGWVAFSDRSFEYRNSDNENWRVFPRY